MQYATLHKRRRASRHNLAPNDLSTAAIYRFEQVERGQLSSKKEQSNGEEERKIT